MDAPNRRVLMLAYYYPPLLASGTSRTVGFATHLPTFGWHPVILTVGKARDAWVPLGAPIPPDMDVHRTYEWPLDSLMEFGHGALDRLALPFGKELSRNYLRDIICIPDSHIAWFTTLPGLRIGPTSDVIYASCSPFSSAISASLIGRLTGRPVVVDFRDAWSLNPHSQQLAAHRRLVAVLERWVLRHCSRLIVNTEGALALYRERYPDAAKKIVSIPNGYDQLQPAPDRAFSPDSFTIVHVGSFYGRRSPNALLDVLTELNDPRVEFIQVGGPWPGLEHYVSRLRITVTGVVPRERALTLMQNASLLYLKQGVEDGVDNYIAVAAKTYEYLATGLPILADCPPGDNAALVARYGIGSHVVVSGVPDDLLTAVTNAITTRGHSGLIRPEFAAHFSRLALTGQLAHLFDDITTH